ncbi:MAG: hypothetical protein KME49_12735 [Brasilonema octagenarum HA4186-MV1]|nr:hypothetical protein [Brasilonema octagenarum HA4186-MV1]
MQYTLELAPLHAYTRQIPTEGDPLRLRSAPYACGTATPIGASCTPVPWLGGNPEQSPQRGEPQRQMPATGNPSSALAPQGAALGTGLAPQRA